MNLQASRQAWYTYPGGAQDFPPGESAMRSILIRDTTRAEREQIVTESIGNISGACDGCMAGLADMYADYIEGRREIRDINQEFSRTRGPQSSKRDMEKG